MSNHLKSLIAVGASFFAVFAASIWMVRSHGRYALVKQENVRLASELAVSREYAEAAAALAKDVRETSGKADELEKRLASRSMQGPQLVEAIVAATTAAGMDMASLAELGEPAHGSGVDAGVSLLDVVSYSVSVDGSYAELVSFLQVIDKWEFLHRIQSFKVAALRGQDEDATLRASMIISSFSAKERP